MYIEIDSIIVIIVIVTISISIMLGMIVSVFYLQLVAPRVRRPAGASLEAELFHHIVQ